MSSHCLSISHISYFYKGQPLIKRASFEVKSGQIVGLLGPNGSGKTTSFYISAGFMMPSQGKVTWDGNDITDMPLFKRARLGLGYLPQEASAFKDLKVSRQLDMVLQLKKVEDPQNRKEELVSSFRLESCLNKYGYMLSGGERRRVEIACAIACRPKILLMDEPLAGVDPISIAEIKEIILRLKEEGLGILLTDHNIRVALNVCDYNYVLNLGAVEIEGNSQVIRESSKVKEFYLGKFLDE